MKISEFYDKLEQHDWTYEYSDDHSVWMRGSAAERALLQIVKDNGGTFLQLYNDFKAYAFGSNVKKPVRPGDDHAQV